jgi:hypothetical protein
LRNSIRAIQELAAFCSYFRLFTAISFFNLLRKLRQKVSNPHSALAPDIQQTAKALAPHILQNL